MTRLALALVVLAGCERDTNFTLTTSEGGFRTEVECFGWCEFSAATVEGETEGAQQKIQRYQQ